MCIRDSLVSHADGLAHPYPLRPEERVDHGRVGAGLGGKSDLPAAGRPRDGGRVEGAKRVEDADAVRTEKANTASLRDLLDLALELSSPVTRNPVSYTHLRAHETRHDLVCR